MVPTTQTKMIVPSNNRRTTTTRINPQTANRKRTSHPRKKNKANLLRKTKTLKPLKTNR